MRASLFITCYNDTLFPEIGRPVVARLEQPGAEQDFQLRPTCWGKMHAYTGFRAEAFSQAKRFAGPYQDAESVVIPSSSRVAMIGNQHPARLKKQGTWDKGIGNRGTSCSLERQFL